MHIFSAFYSLQKFLSATIHLSVYVVFVCVFFVPFTLTVPYNVFEVKMVTRSETQVELEWTKVNNNSNYDYILKSAYGEEPIITGSAEGETVKHTVSSLSPGTEYSFTLWTLFERERSKEYIFPVVTSKFPF